jgi:DNA-binding NtrC family response regulator
MALMAHKKKPKVLVVDDDPGFRDVLSGFLESRNFHVTQASSGTAALDELKNNTPDIVFLDIFMPGMTGLQLLKLIKQQCPQLKVIAMSGYATEDIARETMDLGATDFMYKPIELETLDDMLALIDHQLLHFKTE